jgi:hypothetical protein
MFAQGEETVYPARPQLGKFCLFNRGLIDADGSEKVCSWTRARALVMIRRSKWEAF